MLKGQQAANAVAHPPKFRIRHSGSKTQRS